jgi:2-C-methyl-D-erythritol 4-phosphate cytidylyltransferase / 2-C-methyl-D-erythritol 2,4-cyclodiphosphate synthase
MSSAPTVAVIMVAAGSGSRLERPEPKAFVSVGGHSILARALESAFGMTEPAQLVVVAPASHLDEARRIGKAVAGSAGIYLTTVTGGRTRQDSVARGLAAVHAEVETVLVHDAARAFTPSALFDAVVARVRASGVGVVPGLPIADTIKQKDAGDTVQLTLDRSSLVAVQTPQGFPRAALESAYAEADEEFTDDAALFAAAGNSVTVVDGDPLAFKITTAWDLRRAESLVGDGAAISTGVGMDIHAFDEDRPLWLGGLYWPDEPGLAGHSDGDAVCHAICDALLSAAGLGDIGGRFGTTEERVRGAHGDVFVSETVRLVTGSGFSVGNVAVQVLGNRPKLASRRSEVETYLTGLVGASVSIAATTADGLGFTGRGEGVLVIATALLHRSPGSVS